jgi:NADH-quinone oxidoreductase subunit G
MSNEIEITIDGKVCKAQEGEFILNVARANDIFVPAICYLTGCSPTLACRICLVEADGKQVYACNAKVKEGMSVITSTENIEKERTAIMEVYDVNHPLQCGVCDQSGECELQQYTFYEKIDQQSYSIPDVAREAKDWGHLRYDPGLCIVCEKCVTVCKDMVGDAALKTVPRGGEQIHGEYKSFMPKDAYAMWNKLNKSLIGTASGDEMLDCTACGECSNVCPTGAIVSSDFMYTSNAWELTKIPATCAHCSNGCSLNYDVKQTSFDNNDPKIYRTSNEYHYTSLCGAGRYGYDFENVVEGKDETQFAKAVAAFESADTIAFNSMITNEEAMILQRLKELKGYKLYNPEALAFKSFMKVYGSVSGSSLYNGNKRDIHNANFLISMGSLIKNDSPITRFALNNALTMNKGAALYFHPIADPVVEGFSKNIETIYHKPLVEESILYLVLDLFGGEELPEETKAYLASLKEKRMKTVTEDVKETITEMVKNEETGEEEEKKKVVTKKVSSEVEVEVSTLLDTLGLNIEFYDRLEKLLAKKDTYTLIVGEDVINHPQATNIAKLAAMVEKYTEFKVVVIPPKTNTLGVSLICDLDEKAGDNVVGYNEAGLFSLTALGATDENSLDMPALNQQEGTFTNIDKKVVPTNAALPYKGYELNDIANALGLDERETINYTAKLPVEKGFESKTFDDLPNYYTNSGEEIRGYELSPTKVRASGKVKELSAMKELSGTVVYRADTVKNFNAFSNKAHQLTSTSALYVSDESEYKDMAKVEVSNGTHSVELRVEVDNFIKGEIGYISTFDENIDTASLFGGYRFEELTIREVK